MERVTLKIFFKNHYFFQMKCYSFVRKSKLSVFYNVILYDIIKKYHLSILQIEFLLLLTFIVEL